MLLRNNSGPSAAVGRFAGELYWPRALERLGVSIPKHKNLTGSLKGLKGCFTETMCHTLRHWDVPIRSLPGHFTDLERSGRPPTFPYVACDRENEPPEVGSAAENTHRLLTESGSQTSHGNNPAGASCFVRIGSTDNIHQNPSLSTLVA